MPVQLSPLRHNQKPHPQHVLELSGDRSEIPLTLFASQSKYSQMPLKVNTVNHVSKLV